MDEPSPPSPDPSAVISPRVRRRRSRLAWGMAVVLVLLAAGLWIATADRYDEAPMLADTVVVAPQQRVDELLIAAADESVRIDGTVDGDAFVSAPDVVVTGIVRGDLTMLAGDVRIESSAMIDGTVHCLCRSLSMHGEAADGLYSMGDVTTLSDTASVGRDALLAGSSARVAGGVARDLRVYAQDVELSGRVGRNVQGQVDRLEVTSRARVRGDVVIAAEDSERITVDPVAEIGGITRVEPPVMRPSKYAWPAYYVMALLQLVGAFLVGMVVLWLAPWLWTPGARGWRSRLAALGVGLAVMVLVPLGAILAMVTVVGLPLGAITMVAWMIALYLGWIIAGAQLGNVLVPSSRNSSLALFVGLLVLALGRELPLLGWLVALVAVLVGLGLLTQALRERLSARRRGA